TSAGQAPLIDPERRRAVVLRRHPQEPQAVRRPPDRELGEAIAVVVGRHGHVARQSPLPAAVELAREMLWQPRPDERIRQLYRPGASGFLERDEIGFA